MRKALLAGLATAVVGLIAAPSAFAESDVCLNRAGDLPRVSCTASVQQDDSVLGVVKTGNRTRALYTLDCESGVERNRVGLGARQVIVIDDEDCTLTATGTSRQRAYVRVSLAEGEGDDCKPWEWFCYPHDSYKGG